MSERIVGLLVTTSVVVSICRLADCDVLDRIGKARILRSARKSGISNPTRRYRNRESYYLSNWEKVHSSTYI